jgi:hypothetical protein
MIAYAIYARKPHERPYHEHLLATCFTDDEIEQAKDDAFAEGYQTVRVQPYYMADVDYSRAIYI